ncbi:MAG: hypothetical protein AAGI53_12790 [Planctomycetota bacterium]
MGEHAWKWTGRKIVAGAEVVATVWDGNFLIEDPPELGGAVVVSPGWILADQDDPVSSRDPGVSFRTFTSVGRTAFDAALARSGGGKIVFWPSSASVLSDVPSVRGVSKSWGAGDPFGLLLDPVRLLTPEMVADADEHLRRAAEDLLGLDRLWALRLTDAVLEGGRIRETPVGKGALPMEALRTFASGAVSRGLPIVLLGDHFETQLRVLGLGDAR